MTNDTTMTNDATNQATPSKAEIVAAGDCAGATGSRSFIIVYGPPASGKTINAERLRKHYRCDHVFDAGFDNPKILSSSGRVMVLACEQYPPGPRIGRAKGSSDFYQGAATIPVEEAKFALGGEWIPTNTKVAGPDPAQRQVQFSNPSNS